MEQRANILVGVALGALLAVAIWVIVSLHLFAAGSTGELRALVHDSAGQTYELPLSQKTTITVETSLGKNVIVVEDGSVFVSEADCPKHECVHQGKLSAPGKQIICLPHRLWIEVVNDPAQASVLNVDAVLGGPESLDAVSR